MATVKQVLQKLGGFSQGVRVNGALRDIAVAQPICPKSQIRGRVVNGQYEPPDIGPDDVDCQLARGEWWVGCEERGHDPYFRTVKLYTTVDITETDENGDTYVVGTKKKLREARVVNATSVSPDIGHSSGAGLRRKMKYKGYRRLSDLGIEEVCQYRACQKPPMYTSPGFGDYCSLEHLNLVAARMAGEYLTLENKDHLGLNASYEIVSERKREKQLRDTMPRNVEKL
jgi:hypothetical protein